MLQTKQDSFLISIATTVHSEHHLIGGIIAHESMRAHDLDVRDGMSKAVGLEKPRHRLEVQRFVGARVEGLLRLHQRCTEGLDVGQGGVCIL